MDNQNPTIDRESFLRAIGETPDVNVDEKESEDEGLSLDKEENKKPMQLFDYDTFLKNYESALKKYEEPQTQVAQQAPQIQKKETEQLPVTEQKKEPEIDRAAFLKAIGQEEEPKTEILESQKEEGGIRESVLDFAKSAAQGATLNFGDELLAGVQSVLERGDFSKYRELQKKYEKEMEEVESRSPILSVIGSFVGGMAVPVGALGNIFRAGKATKALVGAEKATEAIVGAEKISEAAVNAGKAAEAVDEARKALNLWQKMGAGAVVGGTAGFAAGLGASKKTIEEMPELLEEGVMGGIVGTVAGSGISAIGHGIGKATEKFGDYIKKLSENHASLRRALVAQDLQARGIKFENDPVAIKMTEDANKTVTNITDLFENLMDGAKQNLNKLLGEIGETKVGGQPFLPKWKKAGKIEIGAMLERGEKIPDSLLRAFESSDQKTKIGKIGLEEIKKNFDESEFLKDIFKDQYLKIESGLISPIDWFRTGSAAKKIDSETLNNLARTWNESRKFEYTAKWAKQWLKNKYPERQDIDKMTPNALRNFFDKNPTLNAEFNKLNKIKNLENFDEFLKNNFVKVKTDEGLVNKSVYDLYQESLPTVSDLLNLKSDIAITLRHARRVPGKIYNPKSIDKASEVMKNIDELVDNVTGKGAEIEKAKDIVKLAAKPIEQILNETPDEAAHYIMASDYSRPERRNLILQGLGTYADSIAGTGMTMIRGKITLKDLEQKIQKSLETYRKNIPIEDEARKKIIEGAEKTLQEFKKAAEEQSVLKSFYKEKPTESSTVKASLGQMSGLDVDPFSAISGSGMTSTALASLIGKLRRGSGYIAQKAEAATKIPGKAPLTPTYNVKFMGQALQKSDNEKLRRLGKTLSDSVDNASGITTAAALNTIMQDKEAREALGITPGEKVEK